MGTNAAVVEAAYEAFGRGDIEAVLGMLDPDVDWSVPATVRRPRRADRDLTPADDLCALRARAAR